MLARFADTLARAREILRRAVEHRAIGRDRAQQRRLEVARRRVDAQRRGAGRAARESLQVARDDTHRRERHRELGERRCFEGAAGDVEQLEQRRDIGNRLRADRLVGDQQRRQLGDLGERGADCGGISGRATGGDPGGTEWPCGVRSDARQCLREFQCV